MKNRVNIIACVVVLGAFAAPASQAADQRSPASGNHAAPVTRFNVFANLGREGSGVVARKSRAHRKAQPASNEFANLGHEGSGLLAAYGSQFGHLEVQPFEVSDHTSYAFDWTDASVGAAFGAVLVPLLVGGVLLLNRGWVNAQLPARSRPR